MSLAWLRWRLFSVAMLLLFRLLFALLGLAGPAVYAQQMPAAQPELEAAARAFVAELAEGQFAQAAGRFDETVAQAMPVARLERAWKTLVAQAGAFQQVTGVAHTQAQGHRIVDVTCQFASTSLVTRVVFNSQGRISGLFFRPVSAPPPAPWSPAPSVNPDAFSERTVTVGSAPWELPGTLTVPMGDGPFPAVVLVHGSGPHDLDETIGPNKPFKDLAWGLATRGVAVLRYEKRTRKYAQELAAVTALTVREETIEDAQSAVLLLAAQPEIDGRRIFVVGHSLGAMLAPRIAAGQPQVAGIVLLAGNSRPLETLLVEQVRYLAELDGKVEEAEQQRIAAVERAAQGIRDPQLQPGQSVEVLGSKVPGSYWLDLRGYRPAEAAAELAIPVLVLQGERDYQVSMTDFALWKRTLAGRRNVQVKSYPDLNHLFVAGSGPGSPAEYAKLGHFADEVLQDLAAWIRSQPPEH